MLGDAENEIREMEILDLSFLLRIKESTTAPRYRGTRYLSIAKGEGRIIEIRSLMFLTAEISCRDDDGIRRTNLRGNYSSGRVRRLER